MLFSSIYSLFHNSLALLHALTLLTGYMGKGKFIHKKPSLTNHRCVVHFCVYASHAGFVHEVLKDFERDYVNNQHKIIIIDGKLNWIKQIKL